MLLKTIIVILFIAVVLSFSSGLMFLLKDVNAPESKRGVYALGVRVAFAAALMITIGYGIATGQLKSKAPWDQVRQVQPAATQNQ